MKNRPIHIKAVLFRMEGTLVDKNQRIVKSNVHPAFAEAIQSIISEKIRLGFISQASPDTVRQVINEFHGFDSASVDVIIGPDDILQLSPEVGLIGMAAEKLSVAVENVLLVSANISEIQDAHQSGAVTAFMGARTKSDRQTFSSDFEIENFGELNNIVRMGVPLGAGKLPNELLREFLNQIHFDDPSVLINPGVGEDIAAVNVKSEEILILKSDPITFATDAIGQYAVLVNANDIATSGAIPRWFLTTLLFPLETTAFQIRSVVAELEHFCRQYSITLCGGHTEITDAVTRPIIAGMMAGTVARKNLIDKRNAQKGDRVLLTKRVAVEGTAIIAREFGTRLKQMGLTAEEINHCSRFLDNISVMVEANIAAATSGISAMHDITEGGLATALEELSIATGHQIKIFAEKVPIFPETSRLCGLLDIDPLGLIGSGSLLICCRDKSSDKLMKKIGDAGIEVTCVGEVMDSGQGVRAVKGKSQVDWPSFKVDEITKLF